MRQLRQDFRRPRHCKDVLHVAAQFRIHRDASKVMAGSWLNDHLVSFFKPPPTTWSVSMYLRMYIYIYLSLSVSVVDSYVLKLFLCI